MCKPRPLLFSCALASEGPADSFPAPGLGMRASFLIYVGLAAIPFQAWLVQCPQGGAHPFWSLTLLVLSEEALSLPFLSAWASSQDLLDRAGSGTDSSSQARRYFIQLIVVGCAISTAHPKAPEFQDSHVV